MKRTTIALPDEVLEKLRSLAAERHVSLASVIRETLAERAAQHHSNGGPQPPLKAVGVFDGMNGKIRPKPKSFGIGASGYTDTARRAGDEPPEPDPWR